VFGFSKTTTDYSTRQRFVAAGNNEGHMGRKKNIDPNSILDAAEQIVATQGSAALTIDAVAKQAGVSIGGIQYSFPNKNALIAAMFERWDANYNAMFEKEMAKADDPISLVRAHIDASLNADETSRSKAASMMAALIPTPENLASVQSWYRTRIAALDLSNQGGRRAFTGFLATEGLLLLRYLGFMEITDEEWVAASLGIQELF
jgi:AcrR family transcriptional regulator